MAKTPSIAIIGAGIGGLALAAVLAQKGLEARIYEQAGAFARIGSGIQISPNAMRVLRGLGLEERIRATAFQPQSWNNRDWDTGHSTNRHPLGATAEEKYGAPYILMHRGDLHAALADAAPAEWVQFNKRLEHIEEGQGGVHLSFADGTRAEADWVIGADGVHSVVRQYLLGAEAPKFMGRVAFRSTFPRALLGDMPLDDSTKWWGPDRHIVIYLTTRALDEVYFTTSQPADDWTTESWSAAGDMAEVQAAFAGFHDEVQAVLHACPQANKWALFERAPLPRWHGERICLIGDACHPMLPYMAQGAASSLEDAVVLGQMVAAAGAAMTTQPAEVFRPFEAARKPRTSRLQETSHQNRFMQQATNPDWVYGYDAWSEGRAEGRAEGA